jgi:exonuclease SbcD
VAKSSSTCCRSITDYYHQQYAEACALRGEQAIPVIATGHLTTVGASKSDAVRDIYIGTLDAFPRKTSRLPITLRWAYSPGADDRRQRAYSLLRLPISLSFDETGKAKSVHLVTLPLANSAPSIRWTCRSPSRWRC